MRCYCEQMRKLEETTLAGGWPTHVHPFVGTLALISNSDPSRILGP